MKSKLFLLIMLCMCILGGCGNNRLKLMEGTYIHKADENFGEFVIVHSGEDVSVLIDGKEYDAELYEENSEIIIDGQYSIGETFINSEEEPDISNCHGVRLAIFDAETWIEGDFEVDKEGILWLILEKQ